jgi:tripartite-type tricarboxylate transporter receptor subunit TctC
MSKTSDTNTRPSRRRLLINAAATAVALAWPGARAQAANWPSKPIDLIVPWPAGGATDITSRLLAENMERSLGQPVVVRNKPGAGGTLVAPTLKEAPPDGHTIGQVPVTVYRHALMRQVDWDPVRDLQPIIQVSGTTFGLLVPADSAFRSFSDLVNWARQHPGQLSMGSTGIGTTPHLAMEEILQGLGIGYIHVPYKGTADQMMALATNQLMAGMNSTGFAPWIEQGKLRLLSVFSAQRSPRWPQVPTMRELGFAQAIYTSPWGMAAPRGTPPEVVRRLHDAIRQAAFEDRHQKALHSYDQQLEYLNTEQYQRAVLDTVERERALLQRMNLLAKPS